jgi:hypothetical protein
MLHIIFYLMLRHDAMANDGRTQESTSHGSFDSSSQPESPRRWHPSNSRYTTTQPSGYKRPDPRGYHKLSHQLIHQRIEPWDKNGTKPLENFIPLPDANRSQMAASSYFPRDLRQQMSHDVKSDGGSSPPFGIVILLKILWLNM